jgi:hypothetical protein
MPYRKLAIILLFASSIGCAATNKNIQISFDDGQPIHFRHGGIALDFDGARKITIQTTLTKFDIDARTPSRGIFSPNMNFLAFNFGSGSGQVYDLEIYDLESGEVENVDPLRANLIRRAATHGCPAAADAVSVLFDRWRGADHYIVTTEDFSRLSGCSALAGKWRMSLGSRGSDL